MFASTIVEANPAIKAARQVDPRLEPSTPQIGLIARPSPAYSVCQCRGDRARSARDRTSGLIKHEPEAAELLDQIMPDDPNDSVDDI